MNKKLRPLLTLLFWLGSSGLFAQADSTEKFVLLEYGFPSMDEYYEVRSKIAKKWKIHHKIVAGCIVSDRLMDSVRIFNDNTHQRLAVTYGDDWNDRYSKEIKDSCEHYLVISHHSISDTHIRESDNYIEKVINNPDYTLFRVEIIPKEEKSKEYLPITIKNLQDDSSNILYRGFRNRFEINLANSETSKFSLECINCLISTNYQNDSLPIAQYIIRPRGLKKEARLNVYSMKDTLSSHSFSVQNLPAPEIYMDGVQNGNEIDAASLDGTLLLECHYPDEITLKGEFTIEKWEMQTNANLQFWGLGSEMSKENIESLKSIPSGTQISFICSVKGPDGRLRKKAAAFVLK